MNIISITLIGMGPRGLNTFERIQAMLCHRKDIIDKYEIIKIHIIDSNKIGSGVHDEKCDENQLLNTVFSQITVFPDKDVIGLKYLNSGPSFQEWLRFKMIFEGLDYEKYGDYLPRSILGKYLNEMSNLIKSRLPKNVEVIIHQSIANNIIPKYNFKKNKFHVELNKNEFIETDFIFISTGHLKKKTNSNKNFNESKNYNNNLNYIQNFYDSIEQVDKIPPSSNVLLQGFGLTSMDSIYTLTSKRGGKFVRKNNSSFELIYIPSGNEPKIEIYSRTGIPFFSKAKNLKGTNIIFTPQYLTLEKIDQIRQTKIDNKLDFEKDILPLIISEMKFAYNLKLNEIKEKSLHSRFIYNSKYYEDNKYYKILMEKLSGEDFNFDSLFDPLKDLDLCTMEEYENWVKAFFFFDLIQSELGYSLSPLKTAIDVLRDIRDLIRECVDYSSLSIESHKIFYEKYASFIHRISAGPQKERVSEILALIDAKVVSISLGPQPSIFLCNKKQKFIAISKYSSSLIEKEKKFDVLIEASIQEMNISNIDSELIKNLLESGLITKYSRDNSFPGSINMDRNFNPINAFGIPIKEIWITGIQLEGLTYYNHFLPREYGNSIAFRNANKCVLELEKCLEKNLN